MFQKSKQVMNQNQSEYNRWKNRVKRLFIQKKNAMQIIVLNPNPIFEKWKENYS